MFVAILVNPVFVLYRVYIGARTVWIAYYAWGFILNTCFLYTSASTSLICLEVTYSAVSDRNFEM